MSKNKKQCSDCKKWLSSSYFYKLKRVYGLYFSSRCKECTVKYGKEYRNNPRVKEMNKVRAKQYRQRPEVKERNKIRQRNWVKNNPQSYCYSFYKKEARVRKLKFDLTFEQFITFWQKPCYYCGDKIERIGLDRVDNSKGYNLDNVVPCCRRCNDWKRASSKTDFLNHCLKISNFCKK